MSGRLESIDASIARITQRLEIEALPPGSSASPEAVSDANDDLNHFTKPLPAGGEVEQVEGACTKSSRSVRHNFYICRSHDGGEVYHGPTAGRALFQQTRFFVEDLLDSVKTEDDSDSEEFQNLKHLVSENPTGKTELRKSVDAFPFSNVSPGIIPTTDGRNVSRPPQSFVESSLDFFLEEINTVLPLFDGAHLRAAIKEQYLSSTRTPTSDAWNILFNNIVVLVMGTKLKTAMCMNVRRKDLDEVFLPFLANSHRAFANLPEYLSPRLVNIQALITLVSLSKTRTGSN